MAGEADFESDAVAHLKGWWYIWSDGCDDSGGFVAHACRCAQDEVAVCAVFVVVEIGAADSRGANGDLDLGAGGWWDLFGFL